MGGKIADRLKQKKRVPVSVAAPSLKRVRGHEDGLAPLQMAAKRYKVTPKEEKVVTRGACGGAAVAIDIKPIPEEPQKGVAMAGLRKQWLDKTLPRTTTSAPSPKELKEKTQKHFELLTSAMGRPPVLTGKKARYARMGVPGQKWELFVWGTDENEALGLGYGTYTEALFIALDTAVAGLVRRVNEKEGAAKKKAAAAAAAEPVAAADGDVDSDDEEWARVKGEMEEVEEMEEGEEGEEDEEEEEEEGAEYDDDSSVDSQGL